MATASEAEKTRRAVIAIVSIAAAAIAAIIIATAVILNGSSSNTEKQVDKPVSEETVSSSSEAAASDEATGSDESAVSDESSTSDESAASESESAASAAIEPESTEINLEAQREKIIGKWSNANLGAGLTALLSGVNVKEDGTAHRFENGTQGADYRWEALDDGTFAFTDYYGLDGSETVVYIDDNDQLHWGEHVFSRD